MRLTEVLCLVIFNYKNFIRHFFKTYYFGHLSKKILKKMDRGPTSHTPARPMSLKAVGLLIQLRLAPLQEWKRMAGNGTERDSRMVRGANSGFFQSSEDRNALCGLEKAAVLERMVSLYGCSNFNCRPNVSHQVWSVLNAAFPFDACVRDSFEYIF